MRHVVIGGKGQIGSTLALFLQADWVDLESTSEQLTPGEYDQMHVAIPCRRLTDFLSQVRLLRDQMIRPGGLVIVHSTVPVGTCDALGAVHSPMRGTHPDLYSGLRELVKYFGGVRAQEAAAEFRDRGVEVHVTYSSDDTEALKLMDTLQYGAMIRVMQHVYQFCRREGVDFDLVYTHANGTYNRGYLNLGRPQVTRPVLDWRGPGIGGHCVLPNAKLVESDLVDFVQREPRERRMLTRSLQLASDSGLNPFAIKLVAESASRSEVLRELGAVSVQIGDVIIDIRREETDSGT